MSLGLMLARPDISVGVGDKPQIFDLGNPVGDSPNIPSFLPSSDMSSTLPRTSHRLLSRSAAHSPIQRIAQIQRHLSTTPASRSEIRDAYILSAARTPTGKVILSSPLLISKGIVLTCVSSMAPLSQFPPPNSAQRPSRPP